MQIDFLLCFDFEFVLNYILFRKTIRGPSKRPHSFYKPTHGYEGSSAVQHQRLSCVSHVLKSIEKLVNIRCLVSKCKSIEKRWNKDFIIREEYRLIQNDVSHIIVRCNTSDMTFKEIDDRLKVGSGKPIFCRGSSKISLINWKSTILKSIRRSNGMTRLRFIILLMVKLGLKLGFVVEFHCFYHDFKLVKKIISWLIDL